MRAPLVLDALGTRWEIQADTAPEHSRVRAVLDRVDRTWSRFRPDSDVSRAARDGGTLPLDTDGERLLDLYDVLAELTDGAVSPLVGDSLVALGYDAGYSLRPGSRTLATPTPTLRREPGRLTLDAPAVIDVGAAGKGLAVDLVARALDPERDPASGLRWVDASGDLWHAHGADPLRVALEDPDDPRAAVGVVPVPAGWAIAASAVNRRAWGSGLHHVLDARTGLPTRDVVATWAIGRSAMVADGAATALFFTPPRVVADVLDVVAVRMTRDRRLQVGGDFTGELFTS